MHMNNWFAWVGFFIHSISGYRNRKHTILLLFKEPKIQLPSHFLGVLNVAQREEEREEKKKNQLVSCHKFYDKCSKKKISISVWSWLRWRWRKKKTSHLMRVRKNRVKKIHFRRLWMLFFVSPSMFIDACAACDKHNVIVVF